MVATRSQKQSCLVTGGSGFLGRHLVSQLLETGKCNVTVFDIRSFGDSRVKCIVGDLRKLEDVTKACAGKQFYQANQMAMLSPCRVGIAWNGSDAKGKDNSSVAMALFTVLSCPQKTCCCASLCSCSSVLAHTLHSCLQCCAYPAF